MRGCWLIRSSAFVALVCSLYKKGTSALATKLADKIVMRPLAALVPYASNSRTHTPAQIAKIARSIEAFGFTNPVLLDGKNGIVAGHARLEAAKKLGLAEVPTIDLPWLSPEERKGDGTVCGPRGERLARQTFDHAHPHGRASGGGLVLVIDAQDALL